MKNRYLTSFIFFVIALVFLNAGIYYHFNKKIQNLNCVSENLMKHGDIVIKAHYTFAVKEGTGIIKVNGVAKSAGKSFILNRQIFFTYEVLHSEYLLTSKKIIPFSNDRWLLSGVGIHYTKFFSEENQPLVLNIQKDQDDNFVISFNSTPTFYCINIK
ncbi:TPA: hypothetical protein ACGRM4_005207 [Klebsiella oxytoca]|uniref:hypothetical protein n=1 Tax=Klebsiella oxytoca TaxID=571 RepID=UPI0011581FB7|nr:hypothetical protein [Klebsiella oxytoca]HBV8970897.1 hypothetical protein [Klebsiella oxytoca]